MKKQVDHKTDTVFVLMVICLFALCTMFVMILGAQIYKNVVDRADKNFDNRTGINYVVNRVRAADKSGAVSVEKVEDVPALALREQEGGRGYVTYIYFYDGALRELYMEDGQEPLAKDGSEIVTAQAFEVTMQGALVSLSFQGEYGEVNRASVRLRSSQTA